MTSMRQIMANRANALKSLPDALGELTHLKKIDLRWNRLERVPDCLAALAQRGCVVFT